MPLLFLCTPPETRQDFQTAAKARKNRPTVRTARISRAPLRRQRPHLRKVTMFPPSACERPTRQWRARDLREGTGLSPLICRRQRKRRARAARKYAFPSMPLLFLCTPPETRHDFQTAVKARKNRPTVRTARISRAPLRRQRPHLRKVTMFPPAACERPTR